MYHVLVVDDSPLNRRLLVHILKTLGLPAQEAGDGLEALDIMHEDYLLPVLIFLDVDMPGMNGYEVCRRLKSSPRTAAIPIVMCTARERERDPYWGTEQGADAYLQKPFKFDELIDTVKQLLPAYMLVYQQSKPPAAG